MIKIYPNKNRGGRRQTKGQAVVETALVLPLLLILIFNMLGLMLHVKYQQQLDAATSLAATAALAAPYQAQDPATGVAFGQEYATQAFDGTFFGNSTGRPAGWNSWITTSGGTPVICTGNYLNASSVLKSVTCTASASLNFNQTALGLGFLVVGESTINSSATVFPSPVRQCGAVPVPSSTC